MSQSFVRAETRNESASRELCRERFSNVRVVAGIINTEGAMWKEQRRFLHEKLRNFGMTNSGTGKKIMEARIMVSLPVCQFEFRGFDRPNSILSIHQRPREISDTVSVPVHLICRYLGSARSSRCPRARRRDPPISRPRRKSGINDRDVSSIQREVTTFLRGLDLRRGAPTDISPCLAMSISNVICSIIMGVRFHHGDSRFKRFMDLIEEGFKLFGRVAAVNYIPMMRYLPCVQGVKHKISQNREEMADFLQTTVNQHKTTFNKNDIRDLVDTYLLEIQQAKEEGRDGALFQGKNHGE
jgi:hypothetical protein